MAKDPALLVYTQDIIVGCAEMNNEEFGQYCRILFYEHQKGRLTEETIRLLVGSPLDKVRAKFQVDEAGLWINAKLEQVIDDRRKFVESRRINGSKGGRPKNKETIRLSVGKPTEDEDEIEDGDGKEVKKNEPEVTDDDFEKVWEGYPDHSGKKEAKRHFSASVRSKDDLLRIQIALNNYLGSSRVLNGFVLNGKTWFNNWQDWVDPTEQMLTGAKDKKKQESDAATVKALKKQQETAAYIRRMREGKGQEDFEVKRQRAQEALAREDAVLNQ